MIVTQTAQSAKRDASFINQAWATRQFCSQRCNIAAYPEYTGTVARELLKMRRCEHRGDQSQARALGSLPVFRSALPTTTRSRCWRQKQRNSVSSHTISDLADHPKLELGLSQEFLQRNDGWPIVKTRYGLPFAAPAQLITALAYEALAARDVMDIYSTDAKIAKYKLRVLRDDAVFPAYEAVLLHRANLPQRWPKAWASVAESRRQDSAAEVIEMMPRPSEGRAFAPIAEEFLHGGSPARAASRDRRFSNLLFGGDFWRLTREHLALVLISLGLACLAAVPLGIVAARVPKAAQPILSVVSVIQTIPSLALLAF